MWSTLVTLGLLAGANLLFHSSGGVQDQDQGPARRTAIKILNQVEGVTRILTCVPEGITVKQNDFIMQLDDAAFRAELAEQEAILAALKTEAFRAEADRKIVDLDLQQWEAMVEAQLREARNAVRTAQTREIEARAKYEEELNSGPAPRILLRHQLQVDWKGAKLEWEKAKSRLELLENFEYPRKRKELEAARDRAVSEVAAKQTILELARMKEQKLRAQIERCRIVATAAGRVIYPEPTRNGGEPPRSVIAPGELVRARQVLAIIEPVNGEDGVR
jgi:multidrug efflux pump subunit AcrA (membrane-fusion protein)